MSLPTGDEYAAAVQHPKYAFQDVELSLANIEKRPNGLPRALSGNFTITFKATGNKEWAVRCFTRDVRDVSRRYAAISRFLRTDPSPLFAQATLLPDEILVKGRRHPIIKMDWVGGEQLDTYVRKSLGDRRKIATLANKVIDIGKTLAAFGIAHGDLQHGNIMVDPQGMIRLVDYDDIYLEELASLACSSGLGHPNYQHPERSSGDYNARLDRFSLFSMYLSLRALAEDNSLWRRHDGGDECLLLKRADYLNPRGSDLLAQLSTIPALAEFVARFVAVCEGKHAAIPSIDEFIEGRFRYAPFVPSRPRVTTQRPPPQQPAQPPPPQPPQPPPRRTGQQPPPPQQRVQPPPQRPPQPPPGFQQPLTPPSTPFKQQTPVGPPYANPRQSQSGTKRAGPSPTQVSYSPLQPTIQRSPTSSRGWLVFTIISAIFIGGVLLHSGNRTARSTIARTASSKSIARHQPNGLLTTDVASGRASYAPMHHPIVSVEIVADPQGSQLGVDGDQTPLTAQSSINQAQTSPPATAAAEATALQSDTVTNNPAQATSAGPSVAASAVPTTTPDAASALANTAASSPP